MRRFLRENGLSLVLLGMFLASEIGLSFVGHSHFNQELIEHHQPGIGYLGYISSGSFLEATMENWESEFLQIFLYVFLTAILYQKGSAESRKLDGAEATDRDPGQSRRSDAPWPVRKGGLILKLYENSLSLAMFLLFVMSFTLHAVGGARTYSLEERIRGGHSASTLQYLGTSQFWFESLQNWQSEFFSIAMLVMLSIVLRQKGSPQSKPVDSPDAETGHE